MASRMAARMVVRFSAGRWVPGQWRNGVPRSRCDGPRKVIAFLEEPTVVKGILTQLGLPAEPLPAVNAQAPPTTVEMFEVP